MHSELQGRRDDALAETIRTTDIDVAICEVGDEPSECSGVETDLVARADDLVELPATLFDEACELVAVHDVLRSRGTDDQRHIDRQGQILEEGAQRGDAHSGADQRDAIGWTRMWVNAPYGPSIATRVPGLSGDGAALITQTLDGDPEVRRLRERGERVGVRVPPELLREEPPLEELTARDGEAIETTARTDDREHTRCLLADRGNRSWWRRLRPIGCTTRKTMTTPAVKTQIAIQTALVSG